EEARSLLALGPADPRNHVALGDVLGAAGDFEGAAAAYARVTDMVGDRGPPQWWSIRGQLLLALDRPDEALACLRKALARGFREERALATAALCLSEASPSQPDGLAEALELATAAREADPTSGWAACALASAMVRSGGRDEAAVALLLEARGRADLPPLLPLALLVTPYTRLGREDDLAQVRAALAEAMAGTTELSSHLFLARLCREAMGEPPEAAEAK
ncbi:MAG: hypothetical protein KDB73_19305, partial [Planctomycetes bacterium]|nr:hypothetical protein [Planctomycetota bacterium]